MSGPAQAREALGHVVQAAAERALVVLDRFQVAYLLVRLAARIVEGEPCAHDVERAATSISDDRPEGPVP